MQSFIIFFFHNTYNILQLRFQIWEVPFRYSTLVIIKCKVHIRNVHRGVFYQYYVGPLACSNQSFARPKSIDCHLQIKANLSEIFEPIALS